MKKLLIATRPQPHESLLGYLDRCAERNAAPIAWIVDLINTSQRGAAAVFKDILFGRCESAPLADVCGASLHEIDEMVYRPADNGEHCRIGVNVVRSTSLVSTRRRRCPACDSEGLVRHRLVDIPFYTACHLHGCWLVADCQSCGTQQELHHPHTTCWKCAADIVRTINKADENNVRLAIELARLYECGDSAALSDFVDALGAMAQIDIPESARGRYQFSPHLLPESELRILGRSAWNWLRSSASFCDAYQAHVSSRMAALPAVPPTLWSLAVERSISNPLASKYASRIRDWLNQVGTLTGAQTDNGTLERIRNEYIVVDDVASALDVSIHNLARLLESGLLAAIYADTDKKHSDRLIRLGELDNLLARVRAAAPSAQGAWAEDNLPIEDAARWCGAGGSTGFDKLLARIIDGQIRASWSGGSTFKSLRVAKADLSVVPDKEGFHTIPAVVEALGTYQDAVYRLIRANHLITETQVIKKQRQMVVTTETLKAFQSSYCLCGELAARHGVNVTNLADRLIDAGLTPVSGPRIDKGLVYVFRRSETSCEVVQEILSRPGYKSRSGRPKAGHAPRVDTSGLIKSDQVAHRLGVTDIMLGKLVRNGHLPEHPSSRHFSNCRLFEERHIAAYELRFLKNPDLIAVEDAAVALGVKRPRFFREYVRTKRLSPTDDGAGRLFVERKAFQEILAQASSPEQLMSAGEAARLFGIKRYTIGNLVRLGKLKPASSAGTSHLYRRNEIQALLTSS